MRTTKIHPRALNRQAGQGMSEYIIITALIAVAAIGTFGFFGSAIESQVSALAQAIAGGDADGDVTDAGAAADGATGQSNGDAQGLSTYNDDADAAN
ncbi:MAG: pilus assembly protein [Halofilum sp. (in: g-proteobacteria)]|nr:pilus assembly protein [Halofilum sp. (in: g-proteobacteria)]